MDRVDVNLQRTVVWGCLAKTFRPPPVDTPSRLAEGLFDAARVLGLDARDFLTALQEAGDLTEAYTHLFGHTVRGPCPAHEGEYGEPKGYRLAHEIGDVSGFYRAFGLQPSRKHRERADHVSAECEFMAFLALKEAYAAENDGEDKADLCRDASRQFLERHLGRFGRAFAARVRRRSNDAVYLSAAQLLDSAILSDAARLQTAAGPVDLPLREDAGTPDDACISCTAFLGTPR